MAGNRGFMSSKVKILVVDDEMPVATMMAFLLTQAGCEVKTASNVEKALHLVQADRFDLVTLDVDMPGGNGFELFQRLKKIPHLAETPMVFISGGTTIENQQYALDELGAADFIEKPFGALDFVSRILALVKETASAQSPNKTVKIGTANSNQVLTESGQNII